MAACFETVSREDGAKFFCRLLKLRISRVWLSSYNKTLFLEIGRLRLETMIIQGLRRRVKKGQATVMIDPHWRVERPRSIQFGSSSMPVPLAKGLSSLQGLILTDVVLTDCLPELEVTFGDGRHLRTFADWAPQPGWTVLVRDRALVELAPVWDRVDVVAALHVQKGQLQIEYCFDPTDIDIRRLKQFRFYPQTKLNP